MAIDSGAYILLVATASLQLVASVIRSDVNRRIRKSEAARAEKERIERDWRQRVERELNEFRSIFYRLEEPVKSKMGIDIRLEK